MANSTGTTSYGADLAIDWSGGSSYASVAEVEDLDFPAIKVPVANVSNLKSPGAAHEKRAKMIDAGTCRAKLTFTQAQYASFLTHLRVNLAAFKITLPLVGAQSVAATITFFGSISALGVPIPADDTITNDVEFEVSGLPVFTNGS